MLVCSETKEMNNGGHRTTEVNAMFLSFCFFSIRSTLGFSLVEYKLLPKFFIFSYFGQLFLTS